jgi:nitrile hydratase
LREFGVEIDDEVEIRVWDSNSDRRYLVVPERPSGTQDWSEERLAGLVTRNAMIGTQRDLRPNVETV